MRMYSKTTAVSCFSKISDDSDAPSDRLYSSGVAQLSFFRPGRTARRSDSDHQSIFRVRNIYAAQIGGWSFYSELARLQRQFSAVILLLMLLNALSTAVATVLFSLFLFGIPIMMVCALRRCEPIPLSLAIVGFLWFAFV